MRYERRSWQTRLELIEGLIGRGKVLCSIAMQLIVSNAPFGLLLDRNRIWRWDDESLGHPVRVGCSAMCDGDNDVCAA